MKRLVQVDEAEVIAGFLRNDGCGAAIADFGDEHGEFVAAHARHRIFAAHACDQSRRDHLQHAIANRVTERVVDELELIDVEEENGRTALGALRVRQRHGDAIAEQRAVRQSGQRVVIRLILDLLLRGLPSRPKGNLL